MTSEKRSWPPGRSGHAAALLHDRWLVVSGGLSLKPPSDSAASNELPAANVLADIWLFDLINQKWNSIEATDSEDVKTLQRFSHRIVPLAINDKEAFANMSRLSNCAEQGIDKNSGCVEKLLMIGGMNLQGVFNDFWLVDPWSLMESDSSTSDAAIESTVAMNSIESSSVEDDAKVPSK